MSVATETSTDQKISIHIFSVSAGLVGVCLTVIGIIRVVVSGHSVKTIADDVLALDSLIFLTSCLFAYAAMRSRNARTEHRLERIADSAFIFALLVMVAACVIITYAMV